MKSNALAPFPNLLGDISAKQFLQDYWQKQPLLIRGAIPGFGGDLSRQDLIDLSCGDELESRFVSRHGNDWQLEHGPFTKAQIKRWKQPWSLLVQGVNLLLPEGDQLLRAFNFIPYARLDDLMVSYATDGGGVGPHLDSYDVFLLQGSGRRRWRIGKQTDHACVPDQPLKILQNFIPQHEWLLEPGDMLYLPPQWAHDGIAEAGESGDCMTWSIGFRAPPAQEMAEQFLGFMQENLQLEGRFQDPGLQVQQHPAEIGGEMIQQVEQMLREIRWDQGLVQDFLGQMLTEPKQHIVFDPPDSRISLAKFRAQLGRTALVLDLRSQLLFSGNQFYLNGERESVPPAARASIRELADRRCLPASSDISSALATLLYDWYCCGFVNFVARR